jgi:hypothetical protein
MNSIKTDKLSSPAWRSSLKALESIWESKHATILFFAYVIISLAASAQGLFAGPKIYVPGVRPYTDYNNYVIFKYSFFHLIQGKDIYGLFPADHWDLYKYSPAFSLCFGVLAWLPDSIGLVLWSLINSFCLYAGIRMLPGLDNKKKSWILLFCLPELLLSMQNTQSNGLMAGLIIMAFALAERSKYFLSALCIVFSVYIKIFGAVAFVFYLLYPGKTKLIAYSIFWMALLAVLPLLVVDAHQLSLLYSSWLHLLANDHSESIGLSVMGLLDSWLHLAVSKNLVLLAGIVLFCIPLIHIRRYKDYQFRLLMLASVLLWIVIFNHKAESPTFIIAMSGVGIWYFSQTRNTLNLILLILTFILTTLTVSDLVPSTVKEQFVIPYGIKAVMSIVVWSKLVFDLILLRYE